MTRGLVVRCDSGGLGNQTFEAWRHLAPERTLVVLTDHRARGTCDAERYTGPNVRALPDIPTPRQARQFMNGLDVVFCCEAVYQPDWMQVAREVGCQVVVQVNPEMYDAAELAGARIVLPTPWESHRVKHERILPVPVALDRFEPRRRERAAVFYHPAAPAMADRNGTALVLASLRYVKSEVTVIVRGALSRQQIARSRIDSPRLPKNVKLVNLSFTDAPYFDAYPEADVLLLPRRYGGLCLPIQESAALGMPAITTALEPQLEYPHTALVPVVPSEPIQTKGGSFKAWSVEPKLLAAEIDALAGSPARVRMLSDAALDWARSRSWQALLSQYEEVLGDRRADRPLVPERP